MPDGPIPQSYDGTPHRLVLPAGKQLCRVHQCSFGPTGFNPRRAPVEGIGGGRFDGTDEDPYPFLYAAGDVGTAVAEALLRDLPFDDQGARHLPRVGRQVAEDELRHVRRRADHR
ncbi:MAG TPA: RES family NAD+ phosphorylase [Thermoanaerobaculia bacterium]|nr:RES family NAD+ phosphorylase [Thermoanaerobaculia bacterium]